MSTDALTKFNALLAAWRTHDDLRHQNASITDLVESRRALDEARLASYRSFHI